MFLISILTIMIIVTISWRMVRRPCVSPKMDCVPDFFFKKKHRFFTVHIEQARPRPLPEHSCACACTSLYNCELCTCQQIHHLCAQDACNSCTPVRLTPASVLLMYLVPLPAPHSCPLPLYEEVVMSPMTGSGIELLVLLHVSLERPNGQGVCNRARRCASWRPGARPGAGPMANSTCIQIQTSMPPGRYSECWIRTSGRGCACALRKSPRHLMMPGLLCGFSHSDTHKKSRRLSSVLTISRECWQNPVTR